MNNLRKLAALLLALLMGNADAGLLLLARKVLFCQLADCLVQEGRAAHGGLADGELQNVIGALIFQQFLQGIFHQTFGQHFRRIVGSRLLPFAACQAVNKFTLRMDTQGASLVANALILGILIQVPQGVGQP